MLDRSLLQTWHLCVADPDTGERQVFCESLVCYMAECCLRAFLLNAHTPEHLSANSVLHNITLKGQWELLKPHDLLMFKNDIFWILITILFWYCFNNDRYLNSMKRGFSNSVSLFHMHFCLSFITNIYIEYVAHIHRICCTQEISFLKQTKWIWTA